MRFSKTTISVLTFVCGVFGAAVAAHAQHGTVQSHEKISDSVHPADIHPDARVPLTQRHDPIQRPSGRQFHEDAVERGATVPMGKKIDILPDLQFFGAPYLAKLPECGDDAGRRRQQDTSNNQRRQAPVCRQPL